MAEFVLGGHVALLAAIGTTPFVGNERVLEMYQVVPPLLACSWLLNDGRCILSDVEYKIRGKTPECNFFQSLGRSVGWNMSVRDSNLIGYGTLAAVWYVSRVRLHKLRSRNRGRSVDVKLDAPAATERCVTPPAGEKWAQLVESVTHPDEKRNN